MNRTARTASQIVTTNVAPVVAVTVAFALVLAYGPEAIQWVWATVTHVFSAIAVTGSRP